MTKKIKAKRELAKQEIAALKIQKAATMADRDLAIRVMLAKVDLILDRLYAYKKAPKGKKHLIDLRTDINTIFEAVVEPVPKPVIKPKKTDTIGEVV